MNYDRKKQEQLLYEQSTQPGYSEEYIRQANMQSDNIELEKMGGRTIPLEKDYKYQMELLEKQLQMVLDDERGPGDLDKRISILEHQNKILLAENNFLKETLEEYSITASWHKNKNSIGLYNDKI